MWRDQGWGGTPPVEWPAAPAAAWPGGTEPPDRSWVVTLVGAVLAVCGPVGALLAGAMALGGVEDANECESIHCSPELHLDGPDMTWLIVALLGVVVAVVGVVLFFVGLARTIAHGRRAAQAWRG